MTPCIIVHGGAHAVQPEEVEAHKNGCRTAAQAGWTILESGGSALDAVEAAIRILEDDPTFNAGFGSELNAAGEVEMDSAIMDGRDLSAGGVGALQGVRHPISVARRVLESPSTLLVAHGARQFATQHNLALCDPSALIAEQQGQTFDAKQDRGK